MFLNIQREKPEIHPNSTTVTVRLSAEPLRVANPVCICVHVSFIFVVCLIHVCDITHPQMCHEAFISSETLPPHPPPTLPHTACVPTLSNQL